MARYKVRIKRSARKELESIATKVDRRRIVKRIQGLADDPRPPDCQKLSGRDLYRVRQGRFRVVYQIDDGLLTILVIRFADRKSAYRGD